MTRFTDSPYERMMTRRPEGGDVYKRQIQNRQPRKISLSGALKRKEVSTLAYVPVPKDLSLIHI